jgi:hypothetical protein
MRSSDQIHLLYAAWIVHQLYKVHLSVFFVAIVCSLQFALMNTRLPVQRWVPCTLRLANPIIPNWNISVEGYTDRSGNAYA